MASLGDHALQERERNAGAAASFQWAEKKDCEPTGFFLPLFLLSLFQGVGFARASRDEVSGWRNW
jgi:hypothetical protein